MIRKATGSRQLFFRLPIQTIVAVVMPLFSNYRQLLRYYIISYDVAGVFNVIKTSNVAIPWIENRLRFSVVGFGFTWLPIGC